MRWGISKDGKTPWFAWRPVRLYNGQWVWFESVIVYDYFDSIVPMGARYNLFTRRVFCPVIS